MPTSSQTVRRRAWAAACLGLVLTVAAGCGSADAQTTPAATAAAPVTTAKVVNAATLRPGTDVPSPEGKPVLTVTGAITSHNTGQLLSLDLDTVESMGVTEVQVYEPWTKENLTFRGVWLADLLAVAGATPGATSVHLVALDDYAIDLTLAEVRAGGIMLALRDSNGTALPIDQGGPTRIIYQAGVTAGANPDHWIWSLKTIDVR